MYSIGVFDRFRSTLAVAAMFVCSIAFADGPVSVGNVPGGANVVTDTDLTQSGGNGQRWGRGGGRTIRYHVTDPGRFTMLKFGVQQGSQPHVAFDNGITPNGAAQGQQENLSYNASDSQLGNGIARWVGSAFVPMANGGSLLAWTRFSIRYSQTNNGAPIVIGVDGTGPNPMNIGVFGDFDVNLLFEMSTAGPGGPWVPLLDMYDSLPTPQGQPPGTNVGPVLSGVTTAFYYTLAATGMTLEDHDAHLQALFDEIKPTINNMSGKINFMRDDWTPRWNGIQGQVSETQNSINNNVVPTLSQIQQQVAQLVGQGSGGTSNLATKEDVQGVKEQLSETLMIMLGYKPCPIPDFCVNFGSLKKLGGDTTQILIGLSEANNAISGKASQSSVDGILIGLSQATTAIGSKASQSSVDGIATSLSQATSAIGGKASQTSVDGILVGLSQATTAIGGKSSQASVDSLAGRLGGLESAVAELQATLDNTASQSLDVRAVQVDSGDSKKLRWIVKTTRDGALVNASLTRFATVRGYSAMSNVMGNAVITSLGTGLHDVVLNITKEAPEGVAYLFEAKIIGPIDIVGSALMVTEKKPY